MDADGATELVDALETLKADVQRLEEQARFVVRARSVAGWSTGVAIAALTGLVVSLVTSDGQKLSQVALIVAIVAFALQIGFFVVQVWVAAEQNRRGAELASDATRVLVRIDTQLDATIAVIHRQFAFVLRHAVARRADQPTSTSVTDDLQVVDDTAPAVEDDSETEGHPALVKVEQRLDGLTRLLLDLGRERDTLEQWDRISGVPSEPTPRPAFVAAKRTLTTWPSEVAGTAAAEALHALPADALREMKSLSAISLRHLDRGTMPPSVFKLRAGYDALVDGELAEPDPRHGGDVEQAAVRLTERGQTALRLLAAYGPVPEWYRRFNDDDGGDGDGDGDTADEG